jgi:hypothetical protein
MLANDIRAARTRAARKAVEQKGLCIFILPRLDARRCNASNVVNADYKLRVCNPSVMAATGEVSNPQRVEPGPSPRHKEVREFLFPSPLGAANALAMSGFGGTADIANSSRIVRL